MIEPYRDLECEVVWHGSFLAPLKGTFTLQVAGGESAMLTCEAKVSIYNHTYYKQIKIWNNPEIELFLTLFYINFS
jgi:hypothetical protein